MKQIWIVIDIIDFECLILLIWFSLQSDDPSNNSNRDASTPSEMIENNVVGDGLDVSKYLYFCSE